MLMQWCLEPVLSSDEQQAVAVVGHDAIGRHPGFILVHRFRSASSLSSVELFWNEMKYTIVMPAHAGTQGCL
jgi:hypothetical protein